MKIVCEAERRAPLWVGVIRTSEGVVFAQGRALRDLEGSARAALRLAADGGEVEVELIVRSAELDALSLARRRYEDAVVEAARHLRASRVSWGDIRRVVGVTPSRIKQLMENQGAVSVEAVDEEAPAP